MVASTSDAARHPGSAGGPVIAIRGLPRNVKIGQLCAMLGVDANKVRYSTYHQYIGKVRVDFVGVGDEVCFMPHAEDRKVRLLAEQYLLDLFQDFGSPLEYCRSFRHDTRSAQWQNFDSRRPVTTGRTLTENAMQEVLFS